VAGLQNTAAKKGPAATAAGAKEPMPLTLKGLPQQAMAHLATSKTTVNSHTACSRVLLLATAVMRLSKPTLQFQPPVLVEADDAPYPLSKCVAHAHPSRWT
jgi:hypothetical protein